MEKIKITCDSTCDLTQQMYEDYDIHVIPLGITLGDKTYEDGVSVTVTDLFKYADETGTLPKTSAASPVRYESEFRKFTDEGYKVIHINISSEFSACYQNASLAASELDGVYTIDSRNLSSGSGHLAMLASELARQGMPAEEIVEELNRKKELLDVSFVLQRLDYLRMGGRCSGMAALGATILRIKPEIIVQNGSMIVGRKYRGSKLDSVKDYICGRLKGRTDIDTSRIMVTHAQMDEDVVQQAVELIKELQPFKEIYPTQAGCTISSHCGAGCLGVLFFKKG